MDIWVPDTHFNPNLLLKCLSFYGFSIFWCGLPIAKRILTNFPSIMLITGFIPIVYQYLCYQQLWHSEVEPDLVDLRVQGQP